MNSTIGTNHMYAHVYVHIYIVNGTTWRCAVNLLSLSLDMYICLCIYVCDIYICIHMHWL